MTTATLTRSECWPIISRSLDEPGQWELLDRDGEFVGYFDTWADAYAEALELVEGGAI